MKLNFTLFTLLLLAGGLFAQDLEEGLVIHYPLNGNLTDTISGVTAENNGNLTFEEGLLGQAVRFFNQDAYFVTPEGKLQVGPEADGGTAGTFALFVNHRAAPLETDRQNYIAQKNGCGPDDNNRGRVVLYRQNPNNATDPDSLISFITGRPLRTNYKLDSAETWIHLALTIDPEMREWAFFVDGQETARDTFIGTTQAENSCGEFVIGHHLTFTNEMQTFDGLMDDLRFYNRVLTQEEITLLANQGSTATRETLVRNSFALAPNPVATSEAINLTIDRSVFRPTAALRLTVTDISGRRVLTRSYERTGERLSVDHDLVPGIYIVTLTDGERMAAERLVVR
jgi:hypothetical protein